VAEGAGADCSKAVEFADVFEFDYGLHYKG